MSRRPGGRLDRLAVDRLAVDRLAVDRLAVDRLAVGLVALPVLVLAAVTASVARGPWGDQAVILLSTDRAASLRQLVGPYSRFGWSHPGPLYFYLLAIPYKLLGSTERGLAVGSVVLAGAFALGTVAAVGALAGPRAARWAGALSVLELAALGPVTVAQVWNPVAIIVPTGTFLVCAAALARGRRWALPACVVVGSFLVQTDVGTGVLVAGIGALALAAGLWTTAGGGGGGDWIEGGGGAGPGWPLRLLTGSAVLGLILWLPPLVQEAGGHPGNLTRLVKFFTSSPPHQTAVHAVEAIGGALWPPLRGRLDVRSPGLALSVVVLVIYLGAVGAALWVARDRRQPTAGWLAAMAGLGVLAGVASADRVTGPLFSYLTDWSSAAAVVLLLALALALPPRVRPEWVGLLAGLALVAVSLIDPPAGSVPGSQVNVLWSQLRPQLAAGEPVHLRLASPGRWPWQAGVMVDLTHSGHRVSVDQSWLFLFGTQFGAGAGAGAGPVGPGRAIPAGSGALLVFWAPGVGQAPAGRLVAEVPGTSVYMSP